MVARLAWHIVAVLLFSTSTARAVDVGVELGFGGGLPIHNFLDGTTYDAFQNIAVDDGTSTDIAARFDAENSFGFDVSATLLLSRWEIRYMFAQLGWKDARLTHFGAEAQSDLYIYLPVRPGLLAPADLGDEAPLRFHTITAGYRFHILSEGRFRPFVPLALGFALASMPEMKFQFPDLGEAGALRVEIDRETLPGFSAQTGIGVDYRISQLLVLGASLRYSFNAFKKPALQSLDEGTISETGSTGDSLFEAVMETVHLIAFDVAVRFDL